MFPRSFHDPEWTEDDIFNFEAFLDTAGELHQKDSGTESDEKPGVFGWVKNLFSGTTSPPERIEPLKADAERSEQDTDQDPDAAGDHEHDRPPIGADDATEPELEMLQDPPLVEPVIPEVGLKIEAMIQRASRAWTGDVAMVFSFHRSSDDEQPPLYTEARDEVRITAGRFEILIGETEPLPDLPKKVWLSIEVDGHLMEQRLELTPYRSVIQG
jgi:hypothetical protein